MRTLCTCATFVLIWLLPNTIIAQCTSWLEISASADVTDHVLTLTGPNRFNLIYREVETPKANWSAALSYSTHLRGVFYVKPGISISSVGYRFVVKNQAGFKPGSYVWEPVSIEERNATTELKEARDYIFVGLPFNLGAAFGKGAWSPFIEAGIVPSVFILYRAAQSTDFRKSIQTISDAGGDFNKIQFAARLAGGMNYYIHDDLQVYAGPVLKYHVTTAFEHYLHEHFYGIGLEFGLRKKV